jgi:integrase/recombinase XerD
MADRIDAINAYIRKDLNYISKKLVFNYSLSFHCARHYYATNFLRTGGQLAVLSRIMGYSSIKTTQGYVRFIAADQDREIQKMFAE